MNFPHFKIQGMGIHHMHLPVTDINLCIHFTPQGVCDEQNELTVNIVPRQRRQVEPPRANHFSLWLGFGGADAVMLDVTPNCSPDAPDVVETQRIAATVRLSLKRIPTDDDIGCILRELNVRSKTTVEDIVQLILAKGRHRYKFFPVHKQQAGCRHWISVVAQDLEEVGIVGKGYSNDVRSCLRKYYNRYPYQAPSRRWEQAGNWGPRDNIVCAEPVAGSFYHELAKPSRK